MSERVLSHTLHPYSIHHSLPILRGCGLRAFPRLFSSLPTSAAISLFLCIRPSFALPSQRLTAHLFTLFLFSLSFYFLLSVLISLWNPPSNPSTHPPHPSSLISLISLHSHLPPPSVAHNRPASRHIYTFPSTHSLSSPIADKFFRYQEQNRTAHTLCHTTAPSSRSPQQLHN